MAAQTLFFNVFFKKETHLNAVDFSVSSLKYHFWENLDQKIKIDRLSRNLVATVTIISRIYS